MTSTIGPLHVVQGPAAEKRLQKVMAGSLVLAVIDGAVRRQPALPFAGGKLTEVAGGVVSITEWGSRDQSETLHRP